MSKVKFDTTEDPVTPEKLKEEEIKEPDDPSQEPV